MGEFGAVSVVSGNIRGQTNTLPLHIELLYHDYQTVGAFAAASILAVLAIVTLVAKVLLERRGAGRAGRRPSLAAPAAAWKVAVKIRLDNVVKTFDTFRAVHGVSLDIGSGELVALLGPSGLRQDDDPAHGRRPRICRWRPHLFRRPGRHRHPGARPRRRLRLPALCALPAHDRRPRTSPSA